MASTLASDVPFFFSSGAAYCTGRGEILESRPHTSLSGYIAKPPYGLSTPLVYQNARIEELPKRDLTYFNDLEVPAFKLEPRLIDLKSELEKSFKQVTMTGSGTAFFCLDGTPLPLNDVHFSPFQTIQRLENWYVDQSE